MFRAQEIPVPSSVRKRPPVDIDYPLLSYADIATALQDVARLPLTAEDLARPTPQYATSLFGDIVECFVGITDKALRKTVEEAEANAGTQTEGVTDIRILLALFRRIRGFLLVCGVDNFRINDLLKPEGNRLRRQLSAVIAYAHFREERMQAHSEYLNTIREDAEKLSMMEEQHEERDARLKALEKEAEQTRERTKELRKQYHIRETELKQLAGQTSERKSELVTLKADKQRKREELEAKHQALFELGEEITHVRQVVSESPAQLEARINDQRKTLEDRLQQQRIAEQQSMNLEKARSAFDQVFEELGLFSRQIQEWAEQIRGEREAQRVLRQLQIDMKAAQSDLEKVAYHGKQLETQIGQTEERIRRHQEQTTKSTQELAQSQEQLTQEHGRKQAEARLNSSHVQAIEETCAELRGELGRIRHQRDQDMRRTLEESDNLQGIIDRYMRLLGAKMGFSGDTLVESPVVSKRHPNGAT